VRGDLFAVLISTIQAQPGDKRTPSTGRYCHAFVKVLSDSRELFVVGDLQCEVAVGM